MPAKTKKQRKLFGAAKGGTDKVAKGKMTSKKESVNKKATPIKESTDKLHLLTFINNICNKDFAGANNALELAVREKTKNLIKRYKEIE